MSKIVIALGGNALGKTPFEQLELLTNVSKIIVKLVSDGNEVVLTHGNGPQVGQIVLAMDYADIGYQMQQSIQNELKRVGLQKDCVSLITQVLVDENDNAFSNPTKPIGMFYTKEQALEIEKEKGYQFVEDSGRGFRRVVPSPIPKAIIEKNVISELLLKGNIVIAVGGGGIPVINTKKGLKGIAAVIDKDRSAALLAKEIDADILLILTAVDKVCLNYNTDHVRELDSLTIDEAYKYIEENQFAKGSMLPKIEACIEFVKDNNKMAIISSLEKASDAINNKNGTVITRR